MATRVTALPVDSALPIGEQLRRFRGRLGPAPGALVDGAPTRDSLVRLVVRALARRDTAALVRASVTAREFAYFYYPGNSLSRPPYELSPDIMWLTLRARSDRGLGRLLSRRGGAPVRLRGYSCAPRAEVQRESGSAVRIWTNCTVTVRRRDGAPESAPLFAAILERSGRFKVLSFANEL